MPAQRSLQFRLIALAVLASLGATTLTGSILIGRSYQALMAQGRENLQTLALSLASELDSAFSLADDAVEQLAKGPGSSGDRIRMQRGSALMISTVEMLHVAAFIDGEGHVEAMAPPDQADRLPSLSLRRDYIKELGQTGQQVTGFYQGANGQVAVLFAAARGKQVTRAGAVLGMGLLSEQGLGALEEARISKQGLAWLVDDHGQAVLLPGLKARLSQIGAPNALDLGRVPADEVFERRLGSLGQCVLAVRPLEGISGAVVVAQPLAELQAPAERMRRQLVLLLVLGACLSGLLAWTMTKPLLQSLQSLTAAAQVVEQGRDPKVWLDKVPRGDEIGAVAQALDHLDQSLKRRTKERSAAHRRALQAEKQLAATQRLAELGQIAAGLAHELNNPLAVIEGSAREARRHAKPQARAWLDRIDRESQRCLALVKDLLQTARQPPLQRRTVDLKALVQEAFEQARTGRDQAYQLQSEGLPQRAWVDPDRLKQVFLNLFGNAFDAMPKGGGVHLSGSRRGALVLIEVVDGGPGVPADDADKVFQPFYTTKSKGTGLGLGLSRNILRAHGGDLELLPGKRGARFVVSWSDKEAR